MARALTALLACLALLSAVTKAQDVVVDSPAAVTPVVAAATASGAEAAAPIQGLKRNSLSRARSALSKAAPSWNTINTDQTASAAAAVGPAAICGANTLQPSANNVVCRIIASWSDGSASTCSASKIGARHLATAGHCIHAPGRSKPWATAIDVYCTGQNVCGGVSRTTSATNMSTTPGWSQGDGNPNAYDVAVIKVARNLPGIAFAPAQLNVAPSGFKATLTGFPSANPESRQCNSAAFTNACRQYSSIGNLAANTYSVGGATMWLSGELDLCKGHSGSAVRDATTPSNIIGIVSGGTEGDTGSCFNVFARSLLQANANANSCQGATGGASLFCLASKIL